MRAPVSWLAEYVEGVPVATGREIAASLVRIGLEEEGLHGGDITGPLVVGRVLELVEERQKNGKSIRWCQVDVGQNGQQVSEGTPQGIICGATNFAVDDLVVVAMPGTTVGHCARTRNGVNATVPGKSAASQAANRQGGSVPMTRQSTKVRPGGLTELTSV